MSLTNPLLFKWQAVRVELAVQLEFNRNAMTGCKLEGPSKNHDVNIPRIREFGT